MRSCCEGSRRYIGKQIGPQAAHRGQQSEQHCDHDGYECGKCQNGKVQPGLGEPRQMHDRDMAGQAHQNGREHDTNCCSGYGHRQVLSQHLSRCRGVAPSVARSDSGAAAGVPRQ